nr:unnamed protein product [Spirometra erinaceieuropaei]
MTSQLHDGMVAWTVDNGTVQEALAVANGVKQAYALDPSLQSRVLWHADRHLPRSISETLMANNLRLNSVSDRQRYHQLLKEESLGDRKPSELLRRIRPLLGDMQVDDKFVKELFLKRLPADVQTILACGSQDLTVPQLAEMTDLMIEMQRFQSPYVAQISTSSSTANE